MTQPVVCKLRLPNQAHLFEHIKANAKYATNMAFPGSRHGKSVAICGAGPSLASQFPVGDEVWACNSALPYLVGRSVRVTHGFCIDQGKEMLADNEWGTAPDVEYLVSSSVNPALVEMLVAKRRSLTFFHSYLGVPDPEHWTRQNPLDESQGYERHLYTTLFKTGVQVGHGLNSVPRAICLALALGFSEIFVYGDDCCAAPAEKMPEYDTPAYAKWVGDLVMYADGRTGKESSSFGNGTREVIAEAYFDGRFWHTRPDMAVSAMHEMELAKASNGRVRFVGDTLPAALMTKDAEWLSRMPILTAFAEISNFGNASLEAA